MTGVKEKLSTCIIVGAGIGGLGTAGALAPVFDEIIIIDKDKLPDAAVSRKSTVQSNHLHSLLIAGQESLEMFFPGITTDLQEAGGLVLRAGLDQRIYEFGAWMPNRDLGLNITSQSRSLLEYVVRRRVLALPNVTISDATRAQDLIMENDNVVGVNVTDGSNVTKALKADAVVDASGLSAPLLRKLIKQCPDIEETREVVSSNIVYVSAFIQKPQEWLKTQENVLIIAAPHQKSGGALLDIENDRWVVSLNGRNGMEPPTDVAQWKEYARQLESPEIWERIKDCNVDGKLHKFKKPFSFLRRFDKVKGLPTGYFPVGDIINSVNPTFGQGMAIALGHAKKLREAFDGGAEDVQQAYLKGATEWSQQAWRQTLTYESMFSKADEKFESKFKILQSLVLNKHKQAQHDPEVHLQLFKQAQMLT